MGAIVAIVGLQDLTPFSDPNGPMGDFRREGLR
jgi:hypothetical protein